jgi:hypothetical protein
MVTALFSRVAFGVELQALWGLVRLLQYISLLAFINVSYPGHVVQFLNSLLVISKFDVLYSEALHRQLFDFAPTDPLNLKFLQFKVDTKTFLLNSGSVIWLLVLVLLAKFGCLCLNSVAVHNHQDPFWRKVGVLTYRTNAMKQLKTVALEGSLLLCWATTLNLLEWSRSNQLSEHFSGLNNIYNSSCVMVGIGLLLSAPCIAKNTYELYFLARRILSVLIIILLQEMPFL